MSDRVAEASKAQVLSQLRSDDRALADLLKRLQMRLPEIETAIFSRVSQVADPGEVSNYEYRAGLRKAIQAALGYSFMALGHGDLSVPPIPIAIRAQARLAVRNGISLDTVLRRYITGYAQLSSILVDEAERVSSVQRFDLKKVMQIQGALLDQVAAVVAEDYQREVDYLSSSNTGQQAERIRKLLSGELLHTSELAYDLDTWHLGIAATGPGAADMMTDLARQVDRRLLLVPDTEETVWAWLGGADMPSMEDVLACAQSAPIDGTIALGEPTSGAAGWRLTHRQAITALVVARRGSRKVVRYADIALVASILDDDLLATSLRELYLDPLSEERRGGAILRKTLRAFFNAEGNVSSTAAALGVKRHTVTNRLRTIERRLGRPLSMCATEVDAALRLDEFSSSPPS